MHFCKRHQIEFDVVEQIKEASLKDPENEFLWKKTEYIQYYGMPSEYGINGRNLLNFNGRVYLPNQVAIK